MEEQYEINDILTVPAPDPSTYRDRYENGQDVSMDEALQKTIEVQEDLPYRMAAVGSVASHPDIYGERTMRTTGRSLDLVMPPDDIAALADDHDVWQYDRCFALDYDGFAVGVIPTDTDVFADDTVDSMRIMAQELYGSNTFETGNGEVTVVPAEISYATKARRYTQSVMNGGYVKRNDLADMANMSLRHVRDASGIYDRELLAAYISSYTQDAFDQETDWMNDLQQRIDPNINRADWRELVPELEHIEELL